MRICSKSVRWAAFVACVLAFSPLPANADIQTIQNSNSAIWGSIGTSFLNYKEPSSPPNIPDSEHGWTPSIAGGVSYMSRSNLYLAFEGNVSFGNDHYNGSEYDTTTRHYDIPYQGTTNETITNVDGKIGKGFAMGNNVMLTPYAEFGFHYWDRDLGEGYTEDYDNFNTLAGLLFQVSPTDSLILSAYGSAGVTFGGRMSNSDSTTVDLGSAGMYKFGGKIGYDLTPRVELFTTLDFEHFRYVQSSWEPDYVQQAYIMEPSSFTDNTAVRVGLAYHFR